MNKVFIRGYVRSVSPYGSNKIKVLSDPCNIHDRLKYDQGTEIERRELVEPVRNIQMRGVCIKKERYVSCRNG